MTAHKVFVYGSLRRGGIFHGVIARSAFLGDARTPPRYRLVDLGPYPGLLEGGSTAVRGEVYAVDPATLSRLDELEEHPTVYVRTPIALPPFFGVETYILRPEHALHARPLPRGEWPP